MTVDVTSLQCQNTTVVPMFSILTTAAIVQNTFSLRDDLLLFETHVPLDDKPSVIYLSCPDLNPLKDVRVSALH